MGTVVRAGSGTGVVVATGGDAEFGRIAVGLGQQQPETGTLTEGSLHFMRSAGPDGAAGDEPLLLGLLCNEAVTENGRAADGNPLDVALWDSPAAAGQRAALARYRQLATVPFDHERRLVSVLTEDDRGHRMIITKGAPESPLERCASVPGPARKALDGEFAAGNRVVAVATREAEGRSSITPADEHDLTFRGTLVFLDPPKPDARAVLQRLAGLGVTVKILTGDNPVVAAKVCADLGLPPGQVATGADIDKAGDRLGDLLARTTVFARVSPEHKAQIVRAQRATGTDAAFLGDGVNDAVALHAADVGISVDSATDVAKDAADVLLLEKDLDVPADGVMGGHRIVANTMKYVLMGTSSNFGNMFSAAGASIFLKFLPMLTVVTIGAVLPYTGHLARILGFRSLPGSFFLFLILAVLSYLVLIEVGKHWFYRSYQAPAAPASQHRRRGYRVRRRAARFTTRTVRPARRPVEGNAPNASAV